MAELKTKRTDASVDAFIQGIADDARRLDCLALLEMMRRVTGAEAELWSSGVVGFGRYRYTYASGREGDWFLVGFASRKANLAVYLMPGPDAHKDLLAKLGTYKTGKGCLYIKRLADVDPGVLEEILTASVADLTKDDRSPADR
jgi:hypothetical protein